jgi:hypothetical protein
LELSLIETRGNPSIFENSAATTSTASSGHHSFISQPSQKYIENTHSPRFQKRNSSTGSEQSSAAETDSRLSHLASQPITIQGSSRKGVYTESGNHLSPSQNPELLKRYAASPGGSEMDDDEFNTLQAVLEMSLHETQQQPPAIESKPSLLSRLKQQAPQQEAIQQKSYAYSNSNSSSPASVRRNNLQHPPMQRSTRVVNFASSNNFIPRSVHDLDSAMGIESNGEQYDEDEALRLAIEMSKMDIIQKKTEEEELGRGNAGLSAAQQQMESTGGESTGGSRWKGKGRAY